ncbi:MAG: phosphatase PAP2 family protein [Betaproteobacteria bacterium]
MVAGILALFIFGAVAAAVATGDPRVAAMDLAAAQSIYPWRSAATTAAMLVITALGSPASVLTACALLGIAFAYQRRWPALIVFSLCVPGGMLMNVIIKQLLHRHRPALDPVIALSTFSFPSGHTLGSTLLIGLLVVHALRRRPHPRSRVAVIVILAATLVVSAVAASRIYLGVHYLSDVTAGAMEGLAWLVLGVSVADRWLPGWASPSSLA